MPSGIIKDPNQSLGGHFSKSSFTLQQVRMDNYVFLSLLTDWSDNAPSNLYMYYAWSACTCPWGHVERGIAGRVYLTLLRSTPTHPPEACCHRNFVARHVHWGSSEDHTSSRPWFVENGPTGSLHNCSGLHDKDKEFVWNERWLENQQPVLVPWLLWL